MEKTELGLIRGPISKAAKKAAEKLKAEEKGEGGPHEEEGKGLRNLPAHPVHSVRSFGPFAYTITLATYRHGVGR